jgi:hypothetical protein
MISIDKPVVISRALDLKRQPRDHLVHRKHLVAPLDCGLIMALGRRPSGHTRGHETSSPKEKGFGVKAECHSL